MTLADTLHIDATSVACLLPDATSEQTLSVDLNTYVIDVYSRCGQSLASRDTVQPADLTVDLRMYTRGVFQRVTTHTTPHTHTHSTIITATDTVTTTQPQPHNKDNDNTQQRQRHTMTHNELS